MERAPFADRTDAGRRLAAVPALKRLARPLVVAIPRGGVPVGVEIARALDCPLRLIVLRKLFIPFNSEAGFGAMAPDGSVTVDEEFTQVLGLTPEDIANVVREVRADLKRRQQLYETVGGEDSRGRGVILVDDGIAAGYSMSAAARYVRHLGPASLTVAVPCAPMGSLERLRPLADEVVCLYASTARPFAVAEFYRSWHDLSDGEVAAALGALSRP